MTKTHPQYLKPYSDAKAVFNDRIERLKTITIDNPEQQVRIHELVLLSKEKFSNMEKTIEVRKSDGFDAALALVKSQEGRRLMDGIRRMLAEMINLENNLLAQRSAELQRSTDKATNYSVFFSCISMAALLISGYMLNVFIKATRKAESELSVQYSIVKLLNESKDLPAVLDGIQDIMNSVAPWSFIAAWTLDKERGLIKCLEITKNSALSSSAFAHATRSLELKKDQGLPGRVWQSGRALSIPDLDRDDNFLRKELALQCGIKSAFAFPILFGGNVIGVIESFSQKRVELPSNFLDMMTNMGMQIGQFLHRRELESDTLQQKAFLKLVVDTMSDGLVVANEQGQFVMYNPAAEELIGHLEDVDKGNWSENFGIYWT